MKLVLFFLLTAIYFNLSTHITYAGQLSGKIIGNNDNPIIAAEIIFKNAADKKRVGSTISDFTGGYVIDVPHGTYNITIVTDTAGKKSENTFENQVITTTRQKNFTLPVDTNAPIPKDNSSLSYSLVFGITIGTLLVLLLAVRIMKRKK